MINSVPLPVGKLPHYSSIGGSCNVAGAPVATVSPGEFVPVWSRTAGGLLGLALQLIKVSFASSAWPGERTRVLPWLCLLQICLAMWLGFVTGHLQLLALEPCSCHVLSL